MHLVVCPHCWRQLRFRSSAGLVMAAKMTCRYCGATFAAKVLEWQDDVPMPTAQDVYPYLFASSAVSVEEITQINEITETVEVSVQQEQPAETVEFRQETQPQTPSANEPKIAAWAAGPDIDEDVEITAQPRIAPRRPGLDIPVKDSGDNDQDLPEKPVEAATLQPQPEPQMEQIAPVEPEPVITPEPVIIEDSLPQSPASPESEAETCPEPENVTEDVAAANVIEFPKFTPAVEPQPVEQDNHEAIVETASSTEPLEVEKFTDTAEKLQIPEFVLPEVAAIKEEIREESIPAKTVEVAKPQIEKRGGRTLLWISLAITALAVMAGLAWLIFFSGNTASTKAVSDVNETIRTDVETKFDDSPKVDVEPAEENAIDEMVTTPQPEAPLPAAVVVNEPAPVTPSPEPVKIARQKISPDESFVPSELDSSRVEITIVNAEGKILRLASRSYQKLVSGGEIVFDVAEIQGAPASVSSAKSATPVDPLAMKILALSRWGGLLSASACSDARPGLVYVWCEFYGNDGLRAGASKGVLDNNSLSLQPGGAATYRMFFRAGLSNSNTVPDEVMFQTLATQDGVAMVASREVAFVGMPVIFR